MNLKKNSPYVKEQYMVGDNFVDYQNELQQLRNYNIDKKHLTSSTTYGKTSIDGHYYFQQFDIEKITEIDELLNKNDQIYQNLRNKLLLISQVDQNINNNINAIRPIYYSSYKSKQEYGSLRKYYDSVEKEKQLEDYDNGMKYYELISGGRNYEMPLQHFQSSTIQTERSPLTTSKRNKTQQQQQQPNILILNESQNNEKHKQKTQMDPSQYHPIRQSNNVAPEHRFRRINTTDSNLMTSQPFIRKSNSLLESQHRININLIDSQTTKNYSNSNLRQSHSTLFDKEKQNLFYFPTSSPYQSHIDSKINANFSQLNQRKKQIQTIYSQLKLEEEEIQKAYQQYKKSFNQIKQKPKVQNTQQAGTQIQSPTKKVISSPPKKSFPNKIKKSSIYTTASYEPKNDINIQPNILPIINQAKQKNSSHLNKSSRNQKSPPKILPSQSNEKLAFSPIRQSVIKYCTQQIESIDISQRPQPMTARSHIYVPFNKLYKSPIIQMKNKNMLILARQSKLQQLKPAQIKILDGKKYKFPQSIQTEQQQLIKSVIKEDHNIVAIVGGQATLKKKLHMALIAHSFDKILKIINSKKYNCLTFSLAYNEMIDKYEDKTKKIINSIEINDEVTTKSVVLQAQKTIEQIYEAIKRPLNLNQSSCGNRVPSQSQSIKEKIKIVRFSKISLLFGKQAIWSCQIFSTNQFRYEFLKNLEVKDIIWSVNPLFKNYEDVSKTLNQATKYIENRSNV